MLVNWFLFTFSLGQNRPLSWEEFESHVHQIVYVCDTRWLYENEQTETVSEQIIRPTGLLDPEVEVRPTMGQWWSLRWNQCPCWKEWTNLYHHLDQENVAEHLTDYFKEMGIKVKYMHSDIKTLERTEIMWFLRLGVFDVLVNQNLLREDWRFRG